MADVRSDRAQLLIVGGLALAVALVGVGLVLNFAIYTENLATREGNTGASTIVGQEQAAVESVGRAVEYVNSHVASSGASRSLIASTLDQQVARINESLSNAGALSGAAVRITDVKPYEGARLTDQNASRTFTDDEGNPDWQLTDGVNETARFTMRVYKPSLTDADSVALLSEIYHVKVTDADGDIWKTYLYRSSISGNAYLATSGPGSTLDTTIDNVLYNCISKDKQNITVDFIDATFGGTHCDQLNYFNQTMDAPYTISYENGKKAWGTYEILINSTNYRAGNFHDPSLGKSPYAHNATFSARVEFQYVGNQIQYEDSRTIRPVPNVTRFPGLTPDVIQFDVGEDGNVSSDFATFDVAWQVRDSDGDLQSVNVTLVDQNNTETDDYRKYTTADPELSASGGSGTLTLTETELDFSEKFGIRIIVFDDNGNVVTRKVIRNDK